MTICSQSGSARETRKHTHIKHTVCFQYPEATPKSQHTFKHDAHNSPQSTTHVRTHIHYIITWLNTSVLASTVFSARATSPRKHMCIQQTYNKCVLDPATYCHVRNCWQVFPMPPNWLQREFPNSLQILWFVFFTLQDNNNSTRDTEPQQPATAQPQSPEFTAQS